MADDNETTEVAVIENKNRLSVVWLLPVIALMIGGWLIYKSVVEAGIDIEIVFPRGADIKPLATELKFEGKIVGVVKSTTMTQNLDAIVAIVEIDRGFAPILQADTKFWLVEPELSISQVTGLDTLLSGKYITFQFGNDTGEKNRDQLVELKPVKYNYIALAEPPLQPKYLGGLSLTLNADEAGSLNRGAPVLFHKIVVGKVERIRLAEDDETNINIDIYIEPDYIHLVNEHTHFWNSSGLKIGGSFSNLKVQMDSLASLLVGGVSFSTWSAKEQLALAKDGDRFKLYKTEEDALDKGIQIEITFSSKESVGKDMLVKYRNQTVGEVKAVRLSDDFETITAITKLSDDTVGLAREGAIFWLVKPKIGLAGAKNLDTLLGGKYIRVERGEGKPATRFKGRGDPPLKKEKSTGLNIVLTTNDLGSIKEGVKILYRSIVVGAVKGYELESDAQHVLVYANIEDRYAPLVRQNTRFWNTSGINVDFGLFSGAKIRTNSMESLLEGGISFATPDNNEMGDTVNEGVVFKLHAESKEEWSGWQPKIPLADNPDD